MNYLKSSNIHSVKKNHFNCGNKILLFSQIFIISLLIIPGSSFIPDNVNPTGEASAVDTVHAYKFHHHEDLTVDLHLWLDEYPHLMELGSIGYSYLGHELWNVHLTNFETNSNRELPEIYLDGGHHGNEYAGSEITILTIQYLLENYGTDSNVTYILDNSHVYITPMINPDGIDLDSRFNSRLVDLNRNYPFMWQNSASHGSGPASEIEVASNIAFMENHDFDLYITGHTGIVMLIYPWGYTTDPSPDRSLFEKIEEEVEARWDIPTGQSAVILYPAAGTGKDHGYMMNKAPSWTFEVDQEQFVPVSGERISTRLQPIFECYMFLMEEAISQKWWSNLTVTDVKLMDKDKDGFTIEFTVNNSGYADVVNGTATLEIDGFSTESLYSVGQFNETNITFIGVGDFTGKNDYSLRLDFNKLTLNSSESRYLIYEGEFEIDEEEGFLPFPGSEEVVLIIMAAVFISRRAKKKK